MKVATVFVLMGLAGCLRSTAGRSGAASGGAAVCTPGCSDREFCLDGGCTDRCVAIGETRCDGGCADLMADDANCGACGRPCALGSPCQSGVCQPIGCPAGDAACGDSGACVDLTTDSNNCGTCGISCLPGAACSGGKCPMLSCPAGLLACAGKDAGLACADPQVDPLNCGSCGIACGKGTSCRTGACRCDPLTQVCPSSTTDGGSVCADLLTDPEHCGTCGVSCVACETCIDGACVPDLEMDVELEIPNPGPDGYPFIGLSLARGDVNGDGIPDLLFTAQEFSFESPSWTNPSIGWFLGLPDGGFGSSVYLPLGDFPRSSPTGVDTILATADFDGDGIGDIAVLASEQLDGGLVSELDILTGIASGSPSVATVWQGAGAVAALGVGDLNGDGFADVVLATNAAANLSLLISEGRDAGFREPVSFLPEFGWPYDGVVGAQVGIADMNDDGLPDLVTPNAVYPQLPDGGFGPSPLVVVSTGAPYQDLAAYPGGGFVVTSPDQVVLVDPSPTGPAAAASSHPIFPDPSLVSPVSVDLNGDGTSDALCLPQAPGFLEVCLRRESSFDCAPVVPPAIVGPGYTAWDTDGGPQIASAPGDLSIFGMTCP